MSSRVYGASDDLIEFEGELVGEAGYFGTDEHQDEGILIAFDDGTILTAKYGKNGRGVWGLSVLREGTLFHRIDPCDDPDARPHSDVAHFADGPLRAWVGEHAARVH